MERSQEIQLASGHPAMARQAGWRHIRSQSAFQHSVQLAVCELASHPTTRPAGSFVPVSTEPMGVDALISKIVQEIREIWETRNTFCETWYLPHSRAHKSMAELCSNFSDSAITKGQIAYFSLRLRETPIFLLPVKNLTSPLCSHTPISYEMKEFWGFAHK